MFFLSMNRIAGKVNRIMIYPASRLQYTASNEHGTRCIGCGSVTTTGFADQTLENAGIVLVADVPNYYFK
jgi:hypothetical protein